MTTPYLLANRNPHGQHFYTSRNKPILAIVMHVTAGLEDLDATDDQSAERTARYAATTERRVSWHQGTDADSNVVLLPDTYTAFHVAGYNSCTLGRELSKRHTNWRNMPKPWVDGTLGHAAPADAEWCRRHNIPVRKANRRELDAALGMWQRSGAVTPVGFIGHGELDPARRTDPGFVQSVDTFPWHSYLELVRHHLAPPAPEPIPEDLMSLSVDGRDLVDLVYAAANRTPDAEGRAYWVGEFACTENAAQRKVILDSLRHQLGLP